MTVIVFMRIFQENELVESEKNHAASSSHLWYRVFLLMPSLRAAAEIFPPHSSTSLLFLEAVVMKHSPHIDPQFSGHKTML